MIILDNFPDIVLTARKLAKIDLQKESVYTPTDNVYHAYFHFMGKYNIFITWGLLSTFIKSYMEELEYLKSISI